MYSIDIAVNLLNAVCGFLCGIIIYYRIDTFTTEWYCLIIIKGRVKKKHGNFHKGGGSNPFHTFSKTRVKLL